jgi:uroporphyrinogen decarboxylase
MTFNDAYLRACKSEPVDHTPVWFMRQAGRALPEYRALRGTGSILDAIRDAALAAQLTLQPVTRFNVDAAILFSDIMTPLIDTDLGMSIEPGVGPVIARPVATESDIQHIDAANVVQRIPFVFETIKLLRKELQVPLIGFVGAPLTMATYLIEGGPSKHHAKTKAMAITAPALLDQILATLSQQQINYALAQIDAGAQAIQLFDSWAAVLRPDQYRTLVLPHLRSIIDKISARDIPVTMFGLNTSQLYADYARLEVDVVGIDATIAISDARHLIHAAHASHSIAVQGNLDPGVVAVSRQAALIETSAILKSAHDPQNGFIFNLGHGVLPETDPDTLAAIVDIVHQYPVHTA